MYIICLICGAAWLVKIIYDKEYTFRRTPLDLPVLFWFYINIFCSFISISRCISLFGFYKRYEGLLETTTYILFYYMMVNFIRTQDSLRRLINTILWSGTIVAGYAIIQGRKILFLTLPDWIHDPFKWSFFDPNRVFSTFGNPVFLSAYIIMILPLAIVMCCWEIFSLSKKKSATSKSSKKHQKKKDHLWLGVERIKWLYANIVNIFYLIINLLKPWFFYSAVILTTICFFITNTRATYLGLTAGFVISFFLLQKLIIINKKIWALSSILLFLAIFYNFFNPGTSVIERFIGIFNVASSIQETTPSKFKLDLENISEQKKPSASQELEVKSQESGINISEQERPSPAKRHWLKTILLAQPRVEQWIQGVDIIKQYPLFGIGLDTLQLKGIGTDKLHNDLLDVMVTRGAIGLIIYLWLLIATFIFFMKTWKEHKDKPEQFLIMAMLAGWIGYLVQNQFSFGLVPITNYFWIFMGIVVIIHQQTLPEGPSNIPSYHITNPIIRRGIFGTIMLITILLMIHPIKAYHADIYYGRGQTLVEDGKYEEAIPYLEQGMALNPFETCYQEVLYSVYIDRANNNIPPGRKYWYEKAIDGLNWLKHLEHGQAKCYYMLGMAYSIKGETLSDPVSTQMAIDYFQKTIKIKPNEINVYANWGIIYAKEGKYDEAIRIFKQGLSVAPHTPSIIENLKKIYLIQGKLKEAIALDLPIEERIKIHLQLAQKYYEKGLHNKVIEEFEYITTIDPKNIEGYLNLGKLYYQQGVYKKSAAAFREVLKLDPSNADALNMLKDKRL